MLNRFDSAISINRKRHEWEGGNLPGCDVGPVVKLSTHPHPLTNLRLTEVTDAVSQFPKLYPTGYLGAFAGKFSVNSNLIVNSHIQKLAKSYRFEILMYS